MTDWLLDVYPDYETNSVAIWTKSETGTQKFVNNKFKICFYVYHQSVEELKDLKKDCAMLESVDEMNLVEKKIDIKHDRTETVLEITLKKYRDIKECARIIDSRGGYYDYRLFNVDLRIGQRYLMEQGLFPTAKLDMMHLKAVDGQYRVDYELPPFKCVRLSGGTGHKIVNYGNSLSWVKIDDISLDGPEDGILQSLANTIRETDPDIIYTTDGDYFLFPYLYHRAEVNGMEDEFELGRDKRENTPVKSGKSYFSYGNILYKPPSYHLRGRLHIDTSSFVFSEGGLHGLVDLARLSCMPLQTMSRISPGTAISAMQVQFAIRNGYIVLWKKNLPEDFKTAEELLVADRGGMIFDPVVGIHDGIVEVDFMSMYPNIMVNYNISPETLLCDCCPDSRIGVPELLYNTCEKRTGLIPQVVSHIVGRRIAFKRMANLRPDDGEVYKKKANLLKWVLVTCFGYTGYKNARFGRIECHEAINAYGRDILIRTMEIAEQFGYDVLHGIIDSLWLRPTRCKDHEWFCKQVSDAIGIPLDLEGVYKWIVFLPNKGNDVGALNRYYGLFDTGVLKLRGIELRKHDTPQLVRNAQNDMLTELAKAGNSKEFIGMIPSAIDALKKNADLLRNGNCNLADLLITKRVSRSLGDYRQFNNQAAALAQLIRAGVTIYPGQRLKFIICDGRSKDYSKRVKTAELIDGGEKYDVDEYVSLLARAGESLLSFCGYNEEKLLEMLK